MYCSESILGELSHRDLSSLVIDVDPLEILSSLKYLFLEYGGHW